jgi:hypothetical protein
VEVSLGAPLSHLCSFAHWLPKHAALVSSIVITSPVTRSHSEDADGLRWGLHPEAAQQLLQQALQLTALPAAAAGGNTAAGSNTTDVAQQQQQPVRLPNISSITLAGDGAMLRALPAHSLTHLSLQWLQCSSSSAAAAAALAKLSNLQQLHVQTPILSFSPWQLLGRYCAAQSADVTGAGLHRKLAGSGTAADSSAALATASAAHHGRYLASRSCRN